MYIKAYYRKRIIRFDILFNKNKFKCLEGHNNLPKRSYQKHPYSIFHVINLFIMTE